MNWLILKICWLFLKIILIVIPLYVYVGGSLKVFAFFILPSKLKMYLLSSLGEKLNTYSHFKHWHVGTYIYIISAYQTWKMSNFLHGWIFLSKFLPQNRVNFRQNQFFDKACIIIFDHLFSFYLPQPLESALWLG